MGVFIGEGRLLNHLRYLSKSKDPAELTLGRDILGVPKNVPNFDTSIFEAVTRITVRNFRFPCFSRPVQFI